MTKPKRKKVKPMSVTVAVRIPDSMFDRLCTLKEKEWNKPFSDIIREALGEHLNKKGV